MKTNNIYKTLKQNERLINYLRFYKDIDRSELSRKLQLSMPTIYAATDHLKEYNIILKEKNAISLNRSYGILVGISVGSSLCKISFLNFDFSPFDTHAFSGHKAALYEKIRCMISDYELLDKCILSTEKSYIYFKTPETFSELKSILNCVFEYIQDCIESNILNILSIGISCTGIINSKTNTIMSAPNLNYLENLTLDTLIFPDKQLFFDANDIYVCLIQNSDASVIAEKVDLLLSDHIYKSAKNIVSLYLGVGTGAGLYLGQLYSGISGYSGEIGHLRAPVCESDEDIRKYQDAIQKNKLKHSCTCGMADCYDHKIRSFVFEKTAEDFCDMSSSEIREYLNQNPEKAKLLGKYLGNMVNTLTSLLNIELVIFTGKFHHSMDLLINHIDATRDESSLKLSRTDCKIISSRYGSQAPSIGAAIYAYQKKYDLEMSFEY